MSNSPAASCRHLQLACFKSELLIPAPPSPSPIPRSHPHPSIPQPLSPSPSLLCQIHQHALLVLPVKHIQKPTTVTPPPLPPRPKPPASLTWTILVASSHLPCLKPSGAPPLHPTHGKPPRFLAWGPQTATIPPHFAPPHPHQRSPCQPLQVSPSLSLPC